MAIARLEESTSRCTQSSECEIVDVTCSFGCALVVNSQSADFEPLLFQLSSYLRDCPAPSYRCVRHSGEAVCCDGRCWHGDGELGLRNPGACHNKCYTEKFERWIMNKPEPKNFF
jgi:hypothetical protein